MAVATLHRPLRPVSWAMVRRTLAPVAVAFLVAVASFAATKYVAFLTFVDRFIEDWETAALTPAEPQSKDIVIVAITESTLRQFPYRSPVDRGFLSNLLTTLAQRGPRAIGLDILFDQPTEADKDRELRDTLANLKVPLVVSYVNSPALVDTQQREFLDAFVPPRLRVLATVGTDQFDTVRWIYPGEPMADGTYLDGFARGLAAKLGIETPPRLVDIAWHGRPSNRVPPFVEYPAELVSKLPASWPGFKDKIILIGTDISLSDRHRTPFSTVFEGNEGLIPGVVIQAHSLAQLIEGRKPPAVGPWNDFLIVLVLALVGAMLPSLPGPLPLRMSTGVVIVVALWVGGGALFHYERVIIGLIAPTMALASAHWVVEALAGHEARRQREFIKGAFSCYVSPKVVDALIRDPARVSLQGERRVMSFLFTDLANFTNMSESLDSHQLASTLNAYFEGVSEIVLKYDGTIGKFEGDAVFVIFNAPMDQLDHADRAVHCALDIDRFAESFRAEQNAKGVPFGHTRIGVHSGSAVVGNFGSSTRFDYSANGDAVNTAARLEGVNKQFGTRICVSEVTRAECKGIEFRPLGAVVVKGKTQGIKVWEPLQPDDGRDRFLTRYREAYALLESGSSRAKARLEALDADFPGDKCVALHLARLQRGEAGIEIVLSEK